jgi:hypothetical protein
LGSAEIRVPGANGRIYAAPDLIYHYMKDCNYLPPREFLEAIEALPPYQTPSDEEYTVYSIALGTIHRLEHDELSPAAGTGSKTGGLKRDGICRDPGVKKAGGYSGGSVS